MGGYRESWMDEALCAETDPEAFFPENGASTAAAEKLCAACDVRMECLAYALANDMSDGIWGGLTPTARSKLERANMLVNGDEVARLTLAGWSANRIAEHLGISARHVFRLMATP